MLFKSIQYLLTKSVIVDKVDVDPFYFTTDLRYSSTDLACD
jgi:hypothetical protein